MGVDADWKYTIEGEKLTLAEIVERVLKLRPRLKVNTIQRRVKVAGYRTWKLLCQSARIGADNRRAGIKASINRAFRK